MNDRFKPKRGPLKANPSGRRATTRPGEAAISDIAARISRSVSAMTPTQIDSYIIDHGLSHLADPERLEAILRLAIGDESAEGETDAEPNIRGLGIGAGFGSDRPDDKDHH